jgi:hypothetical protein
MVNSVRYGFLLPAAVLVFLLGSCAPLEDVSKGESSPVQRISFDGSGNGSITLNGLSGQDVFLVKVNTAAQAGNASIVPLGGDGESESAGESGRRVPAGTIEIGGKTLTRYEYHGPTVPPSQIMPNISRSVNYSGSVYSEAVLGSTKSFTVMTGTAGVNQFSQKNATLKKVGKYCKIWVINEHFDASAAPDDNKVNQSQIDALADKFDLIYPLETNLLGYENGGGSGGDGGADGDPQIQILIFDIEGDYDNHPDGMILGYFYSGDEYDVNSVSESNQAEIFYLDSEGLDKIPGVIYSTLIHEFNHMINYNVKVLHGSSYLPLETWYTEMLSMLAEDVIAPLVGIDGEDHVINSRIPYWLLTHASSSVMQWNESDPLPSYSANYAFGAYLVRNFGGPALLADIAKSSSRDKTSLDQSLSRFASTNTQQALARFGEVLVYSGSSKPAGVYSFDKRVANKIDNYTYTFVAFDIWSAVIQYKDGNGNTQNQRGPTISDFAYVSQTIPSNAVQLFSRPAWRGATGSTTINVQNKSNGVIYYVMVDGAKRRIP